MEKHVSGTIMPMPYNISSDLNYNYIFLRLFHSFLTRHIEVFVVFGRF